MSGFIGSLFEELGRAFDDARQKVVEEGWFGRRVTHNVVENAPKASEDLGWEVSQHSFDELWAPAERKGMKEQVAPGHERGLDL